MVACCMMLLSEWFDKKAFFNKSRQRNLPELMHLDQLFEYLNQFKAPAGRKVSKKGLVVLVCKRSQPRHK